MKLLVLTWRDPTNSLQSEQFDAEVAKVHTEQGWLKLSGPDGILRILPADRVCLVQFVEKEEAPRIVRPEMSPKFQPS